MLKGRREGGGQGGVSYVDPVRVYVWEPQPQLSKVARWPLLVQAPSVAHPPYFGNRHGGFPVYFTDRATG